MYVIICLYYRNVKNIKSEITDVLAFLSVLYPQNIDDLIVCLVGMGFELEDCQEAVQAGKLAVQAAVEW